MVEHASIDLPSNPNFLDSHLPSGGLASEIDLDFDFDGIDWDVFMDDLIFPEDPNVLPHPSQTSEEGSHLSRIIKTSSPESDHSAKCFAESSANVNQEKEEKKKARLMKNRESAQLSRQRKKEYVEELEEKVRCMSSLIAELNSKISLIMAENMSLKQQLGGSGFPPSFASMHFASAFYPGLAFRQQGSSVPLVPIPKLKKTEKEKRESKIRKVGSITLLGFLFVVFIFGGLVSRVDHRYEESGNYGVVPVKNGLLDNPNGLVLSVSNRARTLASSDEFAFKSGRNNREIDNRLHDRKLGSKDKSWPSASMISQNYSESLPALLYIPRNGKHVEIDGNLIINSVLASEKSRDQPKQPFGNEGIEKGLVIGNMDSGLSLSKRDIGRSIKTYGSSTEYQQALATDSEDAFMDMSQDGFLQQWFREGMAGPIFNSGTCTEVFQFQISPSSTSPSAVITSSKINATETAISNSNTSKTSSSSAHQTVIKNRRFLHTQAIPLPSAAVNHTEHIGKRSERTNFQSNSSMVVSILIDPRENGEGMISPKKSLQRIFVVILLDSVKYVTYSCVLPFKGHTSHLVN